MQFKILALVSYEMHIFEKCMVKMRFHRPTIQNCLYIRKHENEWAFSMIFCWFNIYISHRNTKRPTHFRGCRLLAGLKLANFYVDRVRRFWISTTTADWKLKLWETSYYMVLLNPSSFCSDWLTASFILDFDFLSSVIFSCLMHQMCKYNHE